MRPLAAWIVGGAATLAGMLGALWLWAILGSVVRLDTIWLFAYIGLAATMLIGCGLGLAVGLAVLHRLDRRQAKAHPSSVARSADRRRSHRHRL